MINNQVILVGHLGTDPEFKMAKNEQFFVIFSLATQDSWKDKEGNWQTQTHWHRISVWGQDTASEVFDTIHKGDKVRIEGKLKSHQWTDSEGKIRTAYEIVVSRFFGSCTLLPSSRKEETAEVSVDPDHNGEQEPSFAV
jgi:single-strand DNA-binding protein